jgi:hypothetical protein
LNQIAAWALTSPSDLEFRRNDHAKLDAITKPKNTNPMQQHQHNAQVLALRISGNPNPKRK